MPTSSASRTAISMLESIATHAAIHVVAELRGAEWCNLYTSIIYGREIDLLSVPDYPDHGQYGASIVCVRQRVSRLDGVNFASSAVCGSADIGSWRILYDVIEMTEGFRPGTDRTDINEASFWETSLWTRERIGSEKVFRGQQLRVSNAWQVGEYLDCLTEARWLPIPLHRNPEKLGDIDEIWPSPVSLLSRIEDSSCELSVMSQEPSLLSRKFCITGRLLRNDLVVCAVNYEGLGPYRLEESVDMIDLMVTVDGVLMDAQAYGFWRSMTMTTTIHNQESLTIPAYKARPEMRFPIPQKPTSTSVIGTPRTELVRHHAWVIGRLFRLNRQPPDSERVYDPISMSGVVEKAFRDLQLFGQNERRSEVLVADPYALNERALDAIAVIAAGTGSGGIVKVITEFSSPPKHEPFLTRLMSRVRSALDSNRRATISTRQQEERDAQVAAQSVAKKLNVSISFYRIERLHDRFLSIGERLWHVGGSFNAFGQEISAVVEMRDERAKASVFEIFERTTSRPPVFTVTP